MVDSTCIPRPVASRTSSAASEAKAACRPAIGSHTPRGISGGPSASPVSQAMPLACSIVWANPTRSRHGPSSPNAGIRTIVTRGLAERMSSHSRSRLPITRGEKFSTSRSAVAISRSTISRASGVLSSRVRSRLPPLQDRKTGPHSHHCSQVAGRPPGKPMPSGRRRPSTLITSPPSEARVCVATGPAQNAVKSTTRRPASGRAADSVSSPRARFRRGGQSTRPSCSPGAGTAPGPIVSKASLRYGTRGCKAPAAFLTNTPRMRKWSISVTVLGVPMGATGIRHAAASSTISSVVRAAAQPWTISRNSARLRSRPRNEARSASSSRSARSIITRKSANCCAVMVQNPTRPSAVGTIEGSSMLRPDTCVCSPSTLAATAPSPPIVTIMASKADRSSRSPWPVLLLRRSAAAAATAA